MSNEAALKLKQPPVFNLTFYIAMFERFSFYTLVYMLVLYAEAQFHFSDVKAFILYGVFNGLVFLTPTLGGYLADNFFGIRRSIVWGLILEGIGFGLVAIPHELVFMLALGFIIVGQGFFKTGPTNLLGRSYKSKDDPRIDRGFTWFYMAMNIGSLIAALFIGELQRYYGWSLIFGIASFVVFIGIAVYFLLRHNIGNLDSLAGHQKFSKVNWFKILSGTILAVLLCTFLVDKSVMANVFFVIVSMGIFGYFGYEILRCEHQDRLRILACLALIGLGFVFFVLYHQALTSIELFIDRSVNHSIFGFVVPTVTFIGANSLWVIALGPVLAWGYGFIARKRGKDLAVTTKFPIGLVAISLCFFWSVFSTYFADANGLIAPWWILGTFGFFTLGEMLISALGVAMVTRIAPQRMYGVMMGAWFFGVSLAGPVSGLVARLANIPSNIHDHLTILHIYAGAFLKMGILGLVCAVLAFMVAPYIKRIAQLD